MPPSPASAKDWFEKGGISSRATEYEEAINAFNEAIRLSPRLAEAWINKGIALHAAERYEEALKAYDEAIAINRQLGEAWLNKGTTLTNMGKGMTRRWRLMTRRYG